MSRIRRSVMVMLGTLLILFLAVPSAAPFIEITTRGEFLQAVRAGLGFSAVTEQGAIAGQFAWIKLVNPASNTRSVLMFEVRYTVVTANAVMRLGYTTTQAVTTPGVNLKTGGIATPAGLASGNSAATPITQHLAREVQITLAPTSMFACCIELAPGQAMVIEAGIGSGQHATFIWTER